MKVTRAADLGATGSGATSVWTQDRDAWGQPRLAAGSDATLAEDVVFPGQVKFDDTAVTANVLVGGACVPKVIRPALAYNWHRFYDPMTGAYLEPDPIRVSRVRDTIVQGALALRYGYAEDSPADFNDRRGNAPKDQWYGYNDKRFQDWVHRSRKPPGGPNFSKEEIRDLWDEWNELRRPGGDKSNRVTHGILGFQRRRRDAIANEDIAGGGD